jgi:hypothetical protein
VHYSVLETIDILSRTPATLGALIDGLPETWLVKDEGDGTFSPRDVVGHLILGEKTDWVPRIDFILRCGQEEAFVPFDRFDFREANIGCSTSELCAPGRVLFNISEGRRHVAIPSHTKN